MNRPIPQFRLARLLALATLLAASSAFAGPATVTVGGQKLNVPLPRGFVDTATAAPQIRQLSEKAFTPPENRLLVYGVEQAGLERMKQGKGMPIKRYLSVQVLKQLEDRSATPADFAELKKVLVQQDTALGKPENRLIGAKKGALAALVAEKAKIVQPGFPMTLGVIRDDGKAFSILQLSKFETKVGKTGFVTVLSSTSRLLVKDKLVYCYLSTDFDQGEDAEWLKETTLAWTDSVLRAN